LKDGREVNSLFPCESEITEFTKLVAVDVKIVCDEIPVLGDQQTIAIALKQAGTIYLLQWLI